MISAIGLVRHRTGCGAVDPPGAWAPCAWRCSRYRPAITRSFARIHESNLKKQGLLAFTFDNGDDYDRIREDDRISLPGLDQLAPGQQVDCVVSHADGTTETFKLNHTYNEAQVEWFKAGSALNLIRKENQ